MRTAVFSMLFLLATSIALAADVTIAYPSNSSLQYRQGIAVVDSAAIDGPNDSSLPLIPTNQHPSLHVSCRFSSPGATAVITCVRGFGAPWRPFGISKQTVTADVYTIQGKYVANDVVFDTGGFPYCMVLSAAPSAGTMDIVAGAN